MKKAKYRPKVLGITIAPIHPDFYKKAGIIAEGVFSPSQWEPDERIPFPGTKKFIEGFVAYAASQILERAITQTKSINHDKTREYIHAMGTVTVIGRSVLPQRRNDHLCRHKRNKDLSRSNRMCFSLLHVRKPYTLKIMGVAVKTELQKQAFLVPPASSSGKIHPAAA